MRPVTPLENQSRQTDSNRRPADYKFDCGMSLFRLPLEQSSLERAKSRLIKREAAFTPPEMVEWQPRRACSLIVVQYTAAARARFSQRPRPALSVLERQPRQR